MKGGVSRAAVGAQALLAGLKDAPADAELALSAIEVVPGFNPRRLLGDEAFTPQALQALADNIREFGVLQPVLVRRDRARILLVAGERRLTAAGLAGLKTIPVIYLDVDAQRAEEIAVLENAQREDLDLVTETLVGFKLLARHLQRDEDGVVAYLQDVRKGRRADDLGAETLLRRLYGTGVSVWSLQRARILKMTAAERQAVQRKQLDAKAVGELVRLPEGPARAALLARAVAEGLSARQVQELVRASAAPARRPLDLQAATLRKQLGRVTRLKGDDALRAQQLLEELNALLGPERTRAPQR
ncbi:ParB/RepB/Spo0J family partition protein [Deinococcus multiflagellatus]|uniref:ParB/RepB/Spo0J family partition protein n=1 Tax=Deinococcus multiflagellatus TaxID=1656887 RepID=A0ABW1ZRU0_9DEIO|nr:ParB/RepB/Spo0J family partition protein [Deinococcus multiflagellatus]MBZ9714391.1 ParB/RepB/Spo0J family partition protein [Deinococcus multiflagellatus]